jgi:hypothetical protein
MPPKKHPPVLGGNLEKEEPEKYNERAEAEDALLRRMRNISVHEGRIETTIRSEEVPIIVAPGLPCDPSGWGSFMQQKNYTTFPAPSL